jgi:4-hydroxy-tetrahydrodipicolinate reductase
MSSARVVIIGATGRMGQAMLRSLSEFPGLQLHAALTNEGHPDVGQDAGTQAGLRAVGIAVTTDVAAALRGADVAIDFSSAAVTREHVAACVAARVPLLIGTTGLDAATFAAVEAASSQVAILVAANTSLALNVLLALVRRAAAALPEGYDIEIFESHHKHKVDAPSGTALVLGRAAAQGRGTTLPEPVQLTGATAGPRTAGSIGFSVARGGDVVGEHQVRFLGPGEQLLLEHVATDRSLFARGALTAASWLAGKPAGRYEMSDVLSIKT